MTDRELTATVPLDPSEARLLKLERWLEGWVDDKGERHPGLIENVGELHEELKLRRERREQIGRVLASGSVLAFFGFGLNWLKDHLK